MDDPIPVYHPCQSPSRGYVAETVRFHQVPIGGAISMGRLEAVASCQWIGSQAYYKDTQTISNRSLPIVTNSRKLSGGKLNARNLAPKQNFINSNSSRSVGKTRLATYLNGNCDHVEAFPLLISY